MMRVMSNSVGFRAQAFDWQGFSLEFWLVNEFWMCLSSIGTSLVRHFSAEKFKCSR